MALKRSIYEKKFIRRYEKKFIRHYVFFIGNIANIVCDNNRDNTSLVINVKDNTYIDVNRFCIGVGNISLHKI